MSKGAASDLNTKKTTTQYRFSCALQNARFLLDDCPCLKGMENKILFRINWRWIHQGFGKTSNGVWSGDMGGQATGPPCPIQGSLLTAVRSSRPWVRNEPQSGLAGSTCFSWVTRGFPPANLAALPPGTPSKFMQWAAEITVKAQSKSHAQCPPKRWPKSCVLDSEEIQQEALLLPRHGCVGCWKSPQARNMTNVICSSPADSKDTLIARIV